MHSFSLSRIPVSDVFTVRFIAEMSDLESVVEELKPKDPSANLKPQSSELVDEVFSLFKGYLNTKLEAQAKIIEGQSKIQRSTSEFKFKGNRKQFEVNTKLESLLSRTKARADNPSQVPDLGTGSSADCSQEAEINKDCSRPQQGQLVDCSRI